LNALRGELREPKRITKFVKIYHEERRRLAAKDGAQRATAERRLREVKREITRIIDGVSKGTLDPAIFGPRASDLDAERKRIESTLTEDQAPTVVPLHPGALKHYESMIAKRQECVETGITKGNPEYGEAIRGMIETVTVRPGPEPGRLEVEIEGCLTALLGPEAFPNGRKGVVGLAVAGARYSLESTTEFVLRSGLYKPLAG